jgi:NAD(P)H-dependent FMN reductase
MNTKPRIALIVGSTRPTRFADVPAQWMLAEARARGDMEVDLIDLRDHPLPFFDEAASNLWAPSQNPQAVRWQETLARYDGFIFVVAEYNRSITGALKNALDQAYVEWNRKAFGIVSYGSVGGTRAAEHLRTIGVELQMAPVRAGVHVGGSEFMKVHPMGGDPRPMRAIEEAIGGSAKSMLDDLDWWTRATMSARREVARKAA